MYRCRSCKKFASLSPGTCWKCGAKLEADPPPWAPTKSIDDKQKTGNREQIEIIWVAHRCVAAAAPRRAAEDGEDPADEAPLVAESRQDNPLVQRARSLDRLLGVYSAQKLAKESVDATQGELRGVRDFLLPDVKERLALLARVLTVRYRQFVVNLVLFDFRTAGGGRARKISSWLRMGQSGFPALDQYLRPFEEGLPHAIETLLGVYDQGDLAIGGAENVAFSAWKGQKRYVPPSRFTASFPLALPGSQDNPPQLGFGRGIKYAYMGSFGFSEPAYCTWQAGEEGEGNEYSGTRLSLGAYSLSPEYLRQLLGLLSDLAAEGSPHRAGYLAYGGARVGHVQALLRIAQKSGHALAVTWARQMVAIARALVGRAQVEVKKGAQPGLAAFFAYALEKIARREEKLGALSSASTLTAFEHVWVQESALWELAFLGASCLSLGQIDEALREVISWWKPTVGLREDSLHERLGNVPTGFGPCVLERIYAPSGTSAAKSLYEVLLAMGYAAHGIKPSKKKLDQFIPYFEFYLDGGFLGAENVEEATRKVKRVGGIQIWVNLSESLHDQLLSLEVENDRAGAVIAELLNRYVWTLEVDEKLVDLPKVLVIDFTKFGGEMPNGVLYPILAQLARHLIDYGYTRDVVFLRSNLKYNTGTLDRYQSGEVLVCDPGPIRTLKKVVENPLPQMIATRLATQTAAFFRRGNPDLAESAQWALCGEYISLMKKVYLLSDAIASARWGEYARLWTDGLYTSSGRSPPAPKLPVHPAIPALRDRIVALFDKTLGPLFERIFKEVAESTFFGVSWLPKETRAKMDALYEQLATDVASLRSAEDVERTVYYVASYLEPRFDALVDEFAELHRTSKDKKSVWRAYGALAKAKEEISLLAELKKANLKIPTSSLSKLESAGGVPELFKLKRLVDECRAERAQVIELEKASAKEKPKQSGQDKPKQSGQDEPKQSGQEKAQESGQGKEKSKGSGGPPTVADDGGPGRLTPGGRITANIQRVRCLVQDENTCGQRAVFNAIALRAHPGDAVAAAAAMNNHVLFRAGRPIPINIHDGDVRNLLDASGPRGNEIPLITNVRAMAMWFVDPGTMFEEGDRRMFDFLTRRTQRIAVVIHTYALRDQLNPYEAHASSGGIGHYFAAELSWTARGLQIVYADSLADAVSSTNVVKALHYLLSP